jgi:hypothetical protein
MASRINEELMNTNLDVTDGEIKIEGKANPVYADAINVHNKKKKEVEKTLKDKKPELKKPFLGTKGETTIMPRTPEMKKLKLSENLFKESVKSDMHQKVADCVRILIEYGLSNCAMEVAGAVEGYDTRWCADDGGYLTATAVEDGITQLSRLVADELLVHYTEGESPRGLTETKKRRPVKESTAVLDRPRDKAIALQDKRNNKDIWSDIYNELCGDIKDLEAPHRKLKRPPTQRYDSYTVAPSHRDDSIRVNANEESELDFAKEVADTYGVEFKIIEHTSRFAPYRYEMRIYPTRPVTTSESLKESYTEVDTIECGEEVYRVVGGGFNTRDALVSVEDENGNRKRLSSGDVIEFYTWYDKNGKIVHEPQDFDESLNEAQCNYVDTYNGATIYECEGKYSADVPDYNGKYSHSKRVVADSVEELKKKIDDADRQYRKDLEYTNESVKKRSRRVAGKALFNEDLKIYRESDLTDFEFWSGARDTVKYLTDDEIRQICQTLEDIYPDGCTETEINDFFWFEDDTIAEWLGYNSFEEIMERDNEE